MMKITLIICATALLITSMLCWTYLVRDAQRTELVLQHLDGTRLFHSPPAPSNDLLEEK